MEETTHKLITNLNKILKIPLGQDKKVLIILFCGFSSLPFKTKATIHYKLWPAKYIYIWLVEVMSTNVFTL